jgi:hypothetical protein
MKNRLFFLLLSCVLVLSVMARAQDKDGDGDDDDDQIRPARPAVMKPTEKPAGAAFACPYETDFRKLHKVGSYTLQILPTLKAADKKDKNDKREKVKRDKDDKDDKAAKNVAANTNTNKDADDPDDKGDQAQDAGPRCRAVLTSATGKRITIAYEWALSVDPITGSDMNGDGAPKVVLDGYSGGVHCCYTYLVVSLGRTPKVLHTFANPVPINFEKQPDGTALIRAADGVFDYFVIPHSDAVIPQLVLKPEGNVLVDVSAQHPEVYDREIEQARAALTTEDIGKLKASNYRNKLFTDQVPTVHKVLTIVLDYVYSGRDEQAWQALDDYWPAGDVSRIKSLIAERRHRGLLANLACECRPAMIAMRPESKRKKSPADETTDPRIKSIIDD